MSRRPSRARHSRIARLSPLSRSVDRALEFKRGRQLRCEQLEDRNLLAIMLSGVPDWFAEGPGPILSGQVENIASPSALGDNPVSGAVHTVLVDPADADVMYVGATNGGIWKTTNATNAGGPTWTPLTDQFPSLSISTLEFDPSDATNSTIIAGIGRYSSFTGRPGGPLTGLLLTTDGGDTWQQLGNSTLATSVSPGGLAGASVSGVAIRGDSIIVAASNRGAGAGVYHSTDGGQTFDFISGTAGLPNLGEPLDLVEDPGDPDRLYVAIGSSANGGVFRTDNATDPNPTWVNASDATLTAALSGNANNFELAVSAAPGNPVYAGVITNGQLSGIFRSGNQGVSWAAMDIPQVLAGATAIPVGNMTGAGVGPIVITSPSHGLATRENPQVRITGSTGNTAANGDFFVTLVDPDGGGPLTNADGFSLNGTVGNGAYTGGAVWSEINGIQPRPKPGSQGNTHFSIAADPTNANLVYVGGDRQDFPNNALGATTSSGNLWRGDFSIAPGGPGVIPSPQWTPLTHTGTNNDSSPHADSREMRFLPNGDLLEVDDGGIYFRTNPQTSNGDWFSLHGNLQNTEFHSIAYDSNSDVLIGGAQDVGTPEQFFSNSFPWDSVSVADGGDVAVDNLQLDGANQSIRYSSTQNFNGARRRTYDAAGNFVAGSDTTLALTLVGAGTAIMQGTGGNTQFVTPIATNEVVGGRLVVGGAGNLWESTDLGATVMELFATGNVSIPVNGAGSGQFGDAIAAGGMQGGAANPGALYVGSGNQVFVRTGDGQALNATTPPGAGRIIDVAMHPDDWMTAYAIDTDSVFMTSDAGGTWTDITVGSNLADTALRSLAIVAGATADAVLVGGVQGVSRMLTSAISVWTEYGAGLPNATVWDMDYDIANDVLVAGTLGRGGWTVSSVTASVFDDGVLTICGDEDHVNQDDVFRIVRNAANNALVDVYVNNNTNVPDAQFQLANINQINVFGVGGNDRLIVDSTNGLITVPDGIRFDGDGACPGEELGFGYDRGIDTLELFQDEGPVQTSDTLTVGATVGSGISTIVGADGTQTVYFEELEPIVDNVPAMNFTVDGALIGSLLHGANQITYDQSDLFGPLWGRVTIDAFEPVHFTNKTNLLINGENGDDTIVVNNASLPMDLESIQVNGNGGNDEIRFEALPDETVTTFTGAAADGGAGNDVIDGSQITVQTSLNLIGGAGNDTLTGGAAIDGLVGGEGDDIIIDSPNDDVINAGDGNDTLIVRGTFLADLISVIQDAPTGGAADPYTLTVLGPTAGTKEIGRSNLGLPPNSAANSPTLERIVVEGLSGDDSIRVGHDDEYADLDANNGVPGQTIPFEVIGGSPNASDRLVVPDFGSGDLVIHRLGPDGRSGSISVGPMAPVDYSEIEFTNVVPLNPITGGTGDDGLGRLVVFKHDPFETNDSLPNATFLGSGPTINVDPTIDPMGIPEFGVPGDNDFFQFVAQETGTLDVQLYFEEVGTLANGRPGLPVDGDLVVTVLDVDGMPVPIATASDLLDPLGNKIGERIVVPVVRNNTYYLRVEGEAGDDGVSAINVYNLTAITTPAPIPELVDLQAASDSGRNNTDDVTKITTPTFDIILDDDRIDEFANVDLNPDTVNDDAQTFLDAGGNRIDYGVEVFNNGVSIGFAFYTGVGNTWQFTATAGDLNEGDFNHIAAAVWIRDLADPAQVGRHLLSNSLQVTLDTMTPPVSFGLPDAVDPDDGLVADSDTGVITMPMTFDDRVTSDTTPTFWGLAEANTIVSLYLDFNDNDIIDLGTDILLGKTVAVPYDGNLAYPDGYWEITSALDLDQITGLLGGVRPLLVTAEDVAGNPMPMGGIIDDGLDDLLIFIDNQGPQVYDPPGADTAVHPTGFPEYDLFDPKPSENGFTPLTNSLTIHFRDLPLRSNVDPNFLYDALKEDIAAALGNYVLVGDHVGVIGITDVQVINDPPVNGQQATATVILTFDEFLPDDRYTLTISDNLVDPAGNNLDGESNASGPLDDPTFPSGDGIPGGDFVARFTIDSRPEIGTFIPTTIAIDINGNFVWDPSNAQIGNDKTNVDITFTMDRDEALPGGFATHDTVFAGKFVQVGQNNPPPAFFFDQLAVYGYSYETGEHRWLVDFDSDGVADLYSSQPLLANFNVAGALPIAGNFDNNLANGDEIGLYYAGNWGFDFNRDFVISANEIVLNTGLNGIPIVGDFDGNGVDDVAVFNNNVFTFALSGGAFGLFGAPIQFQWGFSGVLERPVAADMDQDGIDDIGLWVPRDSTQDPQQRAEWFFLLSGLSDRTDGTIASLNHAFTPVPFGNDLYAEFGDEQALPIVGNFDPPVSNSIVSDPVVDLPGDYDNSGTVDGADYAVWKENFGRAGIGLPGDGNLDGVVNIADMSIWRDNLGATRPLVVETAVTPLAGDYDGSGTVDQEDYLKWKANFGLQGDGIEGDGNGDGRVDLADYSVWRANLGQSDPSASSVTSALVVESSVAATTATEDVAETAAPAFMLAFDELAEDDGAVSRAGTEQPLADGSAGDELLLLALQSPLGKLEAADTESAYSDADADAALETALAEDWSWDGSFDSL